MPLNGMEVIVDANIVKPGVNETVSRTWRDRLFSRPWRPWVKTKTVRGPERPGWVIIGGRLYCHPAVFAELKAISVGPLLAPAGSWQGERVTR